MTKILLVLSLCLPLDAIAQWQLHPTPVTEDLYTVQRISSSTIYCAGSGKFLKSTNGGTSWTSNNLIDQSGQGIIGSIFLDIHFFDALNGVATGWIYTGNSECIFRTTNGGASWTLVSISNDGDWPRQLEEMTFPTSQTGYAVGSNGRILKTTNAGQTWSAQSSGVNWRLYAVEFTSENVGIACGNGGILRTTNGGANWAKVLQIQDEIMDIAMVDANNGIAISRYGGMYLTQNGGLNWIQKPAPFQDADHVTAFSNLEFIVLTSQGAFKTKSAGDYWEYFNQPGYEWMHSADFSGTPGIVVADDGKLWTVTNNGGPAWPHAQFAPDDASLICPNETVHFNNLSDPSYTFNWLKNGQVISSGFDLDISFPVPDQTENIALVAFNGTYRDTAFWEGYVQPLPAPSTIFPSTDAPAYCTGSQVQVLVQDVSGPETVYQLFVNQQPVGPAQPGTFSTLYFNYASANASDQLAVKATLTNECGTGSNFFPVEVQVHPEVIGAYAFTASSTAICASQTINLALSSSQPGIYYQLYKEGAPWKDPVVGSGQALNFPTVQLFDTSVFTLKAVDPNTGCSISWPQSNTITVWPKPEAYFTFPTLNPEQGEVIEVINASSDLNGLYLWTLLNNGVPQVFQQAQLPPLSFDHPGVYPLTLTLQSPYGCRDSITRIIRVPQPATPGVCKATQLSFDLGFILPNATAVDVENNLVLMAKVDYTLGVLATSGRGDSLFSRFPFSFDHYRHLLVKIGPSGVPKWMTFMEHESVFADVTAVTTDSAGNIFAAYYHAGPYSNVRLFSTDGSQHPLTPGGTELSEGIVLMKYDPNGRLLWNTTLPDVYTTNNIAVKIDPQGNILLMGQLYLAKLDANGQRLWAIPWNQSNYGFADITLDEAGNIYAVENFNMRVLKISPEGQTTTLFGPVSLLNAQSGVTCDAIRLDETGNIYVCGNYYGNVQIENVVLSDPLMGTNNDDLLVIKLTNDGELKWVAPLTFNGNQPVGKGFDVKNGKIGYYNFCSQASAIYWGNQQPVQVDQSGHFLWTFDTDGDNHHLNVLNEGVPNSCEAVVPYDIFHFIGNDKTTLMYDFRQSIEVGNSTFHPAFGAQGCNQLFVRGRWDCFSIPSVQTKEPESSIGALKIFPNPASNDVVNFESGGMLVEQLLIYDQTGRQVRQVRNPGYSFQTSGLPSGFYTIRALSDTGQVLTAVLVLNRND